MKTKKEPKVKKRTQAAIVLCVMFLCVIVIGVLLLFQVRSIQVRGNEYVEENDIIEWVQQQDDVGNTLYLIGKFQLTKPELLPALQDVKLGLKNPWTLKVTVKEKVLAGYLVVGEDNVYFDEEGIVLAKMKGKWGTAPCINGIQVDKVELFKELPVSKENKKAFQNLLNMNETLQEYELSPDKIVCVGAELYLLFGNKCVNLGDNYLEGRVAQIKPILEKLGEQGGTLHLEHFEESTTTIKFEKDVLPSEVQI